MFEATVDFVTIVVRVFDLYEAFVEWPARCVMMTKKADNKRKVSLEKEDTYI